MCISLFWIAECFTDSHMESDSEGGFLHGLKEYRMGRLGGRSIGVLVEGMSWSMEDGEDGGSPPSSDSFEGPGGADVSWTHIVGA